MKLFLLQERHLAFPPDHDLQAIIDTHFRLIEDETHEWVGLYVSPDGEYFTIGGIVDLWCPMEGYAEELFTLKSVHLTWSDAAKAKRATDRITVLEVPSNKPSFLTKVLTWCGTLYKYKRRVWKQ